MSLKLKLFFLADDYKIYKAVKKYGGECILTSKKHKNGTERICEIAKKLNAEFIVDIQCDACFINPSDIDKLITFHKKNENSEIVTFVGGSISLICRGCYICLLAVTTRVRP